MLMSSLTSPTGRPPLARSITGTILTPSLPNQPSNHPLLGTIQPPYLPNLQCSINSPHPRPRVGSPWQNMGLGSGGDTRHQVGLPIVCWWMSKPPKYRYFCVIQGLDWKSETQGLTGEVVLRELYSESFNQQNVTKSSYDPIT